MNTFDDCKLGVVNTPTEVTTQQENHAATLQLLRQARHRICIYAPNLDPSIYHKTDVRDTLRQLATRNHHLKIQILVEDIQKIVQDGHLLIELSRRISSYMQIRNIHPDYTDATQSYLLVDGVGILIREDYNRYEGQIHFNAPLLGKQYQTSFTQAWEHGKVDANVRRLHL